jgi:hypothetical protein
MSPGLAPEAAMPARTGTRAAAGSWALEQTVIRRTSSGTTGPSSSFTMVAAGM